MFVVQPRSIVAMFVVQPRSIVEMFVVQPRSIVAMFVVQPRSIVAMFVVQTRSIVAMFVVQPRSIVALFVVQPRSIVAMFVVQHFKPFSADSGISGLMIYRISRSELTLSNIYIYIYLLFQATDGRKITIYRCDYFHLTRYVSIY
jgi:hypothetical protein